MANLARRQFLRLAGSGLIASATMAEVGLWAEFVDWLRRRPVWSFPTSTSEFTYYDVNVVTMRYITENFVDLYFKESPVFRKLCYTHPAGSEITLIAEAA